MARQTFPRLNFAVRAARRKSEYRQSRDDGDAKLADAAKMATAGAGEVGSPGGSAERMPVADEQSRSEQKLLDMLKDVLMRLDNIEAHVNPRDFGSYSQMLSPSRQRSAPVPVASRASDFRLAAAPDSIDFPVAARALADPPSVEGSTAAGAPVELSSHSPGHRPPSSSSRRGMSAFDDGSGADTEDSDGVGEDSDGVGEDSDGVGQDSDGVGQDSEADSDDETRSVSVMFAPEDGPFWDDVVSVSPEAIAQRPRSLPSTQLRSNTLNLDAAIDVLETSRRVSVVADKPAGKDEAFQSAVL